MSQDVYHTALSMLLGEEKGYANNKADHGGATNYGVTQATYDKWRRKQGLHLQPVKFITRVEVESLYFTEYWLVGKCNLMPAKVACLHLDTCVNMGPPEAALLIQRAAGVEADGDIGNVTLGAITRADEAQLIGRYLDARELFYRTDAQRDRSQVVFLAGWLNRNAHLRRELA